MFSGFYPSSMYFLVIRPREQFKIIEAIVASVAILVMNFMACWPWAVVSFPDENMNFHVASIKPNYFVALAVRVDVESFEQFSVRSPGKRAITVP